MYVYTIGTGLSFRTCKIVRRLEKEKGPHNLSRLSDVSVEILINYARSFFFYPTLASLVFKR